MYSKSYLIILVLLLIGCNSNDDKNGLEQPNGTMQAVSEQGIEETYQEFMEGLREQEPISIVAEVDYQHQAGLVNKEIEPLKIVFFANPDLGTPLLQQNQLAGLDLPLRMLFFEHHDETYVMYNSSEFLEARYGLEGIPALQNISDALQNMSSAATNGNLERAEEHRIAAGEGIINVESEQPFNETYLTIRRALIENPDWTLVAEVNHQENAEDAGMQLRPTRLFIASNPFLETVFLEDHPTAGVDFPLGILVWEDESETVRISYNSTSYLQERYGLTGDIDLAEIADTFEDLAVVAATDTTRYRTPDIIEEN